MAQTQCRVVVDGDTLEDRGDTVEEIISFDYSSDAMAIAEEAHFTVSNKGKKYRDKLRIGQRVQLFTQHPTVNGGAPTLRHVGRITRRNPRYSPRDGSVIQITSSDLGWHLQESHAPLWFNFRGKTYADLVDPTVSAPGPDGKPRYFLDPSWGFKSPTYFNGNIRRALKLGVSVQKAQLNQEKGDFTLPLLVQVEPGVSPANSIIDFARRINLLLNVSPDGHICCYLPDYKQEPLYSLRLRDGDSLNNVLEAQIMEEARTRYTDVEVVGDPFFPPENVDIANPNGVKTRGRVHHDGYAGVAGALPFVHRYTAADSEMYSDNLAEKMAEWIYKRGMFDSWYATYKVPEHHQGGVWWESNTMAHVDDDEHGLTGNFWVQSVRCIGTKGEGDITEAVLRMPYLLSAGLPDWSTVAKTSQHKASSVKGKPQKGS